MIHATPRLETPHTSRPPARRAKMAALSAIVNGVPSAPPPSPVKFPDLATELQLLRQENAQLRQDNERLRADYEAVSFLLEVRLPLLTPCALSLAMSPIAPQARLYGALGLGGNGPDLLDKLPLLGRHVCLCGWYECVQLQSAPLRGLPGILHRQPPLAMQARVPIVLAVATRAGAHEAARGPTRPAQRSDFIKDSLCLEPLIGIHLAKRLPELKDPRTVLLRRSTTL